MATSCVWSLDTNYQHCAQKRLSVTSLGHQLSNMGMQLVVGV